MIENGFYWHVHHDILLEYCYDFETRVWFIKNKKPWRERKTRLRLFKPVKGELPCVFRVPYYSRYNENKDVLALHKKECPNCPWDGKTIFPKWYRRVIIYISHLLKS